VFLLQIRHGEFLVHLHDSASAATVLSRGGKTRWGTVQAWAIPSKNEQTPEYQSYSLQKELQSTDVYTHSAQLFFRPDKSALVGVFSQFGHVTACRFIYDENGKFNHEGLVRFASPGAARRYDVYFRPCYSSTS
jgi:hypothetical protein